MTINLESFRYPFESEIANESEGAKSAHRSAFQGILDLNQAVASLKSQLTTTTTTTTTAATTSTTAETIIQASTIIGTVSNQTGLTSYTTQQSDYGAFILLSDASPVAVTLASAGTAPAISLPWYATFINLGAGTVTITPSAGTINGAGSFLLLTNCVVTIPYDGANFWIDPILALPQNFPAVAHEFFSAYDSTTGAFTARVIVESDLPASSQVGTFGITIDGGTSVPATGIKGFITIPYNCTITSWTIMDASNPAITNGSASVDVWFLAGSAPPTAPNVPALANKISASAPIAMSTVQSASGGAAAISTWTTVLTVWGTLGFNLSSVTNCQRLAIQIQVQRS